MKRLTAMLLLIATPAQAQSSLSAAMPYGRYGLDAASCRAGDIFATVTTKRIDLPVMSCTGLDIDQTLSSGGTALWSVTAKSCIAEGQTRGRAQTFQLERGDKGLRLLWPNGDKGGWLTRCDGGRR